MAKISVAGKAVVLTSELKAEAIQLVKKYRKSELTLFGGEDGKEPIFMIDFAEGGKPTVGEYGITFTDMNGEGKAQVTIVVEDASKEAVADKFGNAVLNLKKLEEKLTTTAEEIKAQRNEMMESINVL